jgi:hypothetical protein
LAGSGILTPTVVRACRIDRRWGIVGVRVIAGLPGAGIGSSPGGRVDGLSSLHKEPRI